MSGNKVDMELKKHSLNMSPANAVPSEFEQATCLSRLDPFSFRSSTNRDTHEPAYLIPISQFLRSEGMTPTPRRGSGQGRTPSSRSNEKRKTKHGLSTPPSSRGNSRKKNNKLLAKLQQVHESLKKRKKVSPSKSKTDRKTDTEEAVETSANTQPLAADTAGNYDSDAVEDEEQQPAAQDTQPDPLDSGDEVDLSRLADAGSEQPVKRTSAKTDDGMSTAHQHDASSEDDSGEGDGVSVHAVSSGDEIAVSSGDEMVKPTEDPVTAPRKQATATSQRTKTRSQSAKEQPSTPHHTKGLLKRKTTPGSYAPPETTEDDVESEAEDASDDEYMGDAVSDSDVESEQDAGGEIDSKAAADLMDVDDEIVVTPANPLPFRGRRPSTNQQRSIATPRSSRALQTISKSRPRESVARAKQRTAEESKPPKPFVWKNTYFFRFAPRRYDICLHPYHADYQLPPNARELKPPPKTYERPRVSLHVGIVSVLARTQKRKVAKTGGIKKVIVPYGNDAEMVPAVTETKLRDSVTKSFLGIDEVIFTRSMEDPEYRTEQEAALLARFQNLDDTEHKRVIEEFTNWRYERRRSEYAVIRRIMREGYMNLFHPNSIVRAQSTVESLQQLWLFIREEERLEEEEAIPVQYAGRRSEPVIELANIPEQKLMALKKISGLKEEDDLVEHAKSTVKAKWASQQKAWDKAKKPKGPRPHTAPADLSKRFRQAHELDEEYNLEEEAMELVQKWIDSCKSKPGRPRKHAARDSGSDADNSSDDDGTQRKQPTGKKKTTTSSRKLASPPSESSSEDEKGPDYRDLVKDQTRKPRRRRNYDGYKTDALSETEPPTDSEMNMKPKKLREVRFGDKNYQKTNAVAAATPSTNTGQATKKPTRSSINPRFAKDNINSDWKDVEQAVEIPDITKPFGYKPPSAQAQAKIADDIEVYWQIYGSYKHPKLLNTPATELLCVFHAMILSMKSLNGLGAEFPAIEAAQLQKEFNRPVHQNVRNTVGAQADSNLLVDIGASVLTSYMLRHHDLLVQVGWLTPDDTPHLLPVAEGQGKNMNQPQILFIYNNNISETVPTAMNHFQGIAARALLPSHTRVATTTEEVEQATPSKTSTNNKATPATVKNTSFIRPRFSEAIYREVQEALDRDCWKPEQVVMEKDFRYAGKAKVLICLCKDYDGVKHPFLAYIRVYIDAHGCHVVSQVSREIQEGKFRTSALYDDHASHWGQGAEFGARWVTYYEWCRLMKEYKGAGKIVLPLRDSQVHDAVMKLDEVDQHLEQNLSRWNFGRKLRYDLKYTTPDEGFIPVGKKSVNVIIGYKDADNEDHTKDLHVRVQHNKDGHYRKSEVAQKIRTAAVRHPDGSHHVLWDKLRGQVWKSDKQTSQLLDEHVRSNALKTLKQLIEAEITLARLNIYPVDHATSTKYRRMLDGEIEIPDPVSVGRIPDETPTRRRSHSPDSKEQDQEQPSHKKLKMDILREAQAGVGDMQTEDVIDIDDISDADDQKQSPTPLPKETSSTTQQARSSQDKKIHELESSVGGSTDESTGSSSRRGRRGKRGGQRKNNVAKNRIE
ncbi:hypothetical protein LTR05_000356 [Lithohypha guttulata]|uniref:Uncharacterized protein n=1 Tax=Lithohypha guttulata TaxID=1690604 RepID=A0AAN7T787_9EURO|nr:hypothetical protein LTR05_000356 [Lithohypha guttulata]